MGNTPLPYTLPNQFDPLYNWEDDRDNGIDILADRHRDNDLDAAAAISLALKRDGTSTVTQNIPMNGKRITGAGASVGTNDYVIQQELTDAIGVDRVGDYLTTERDPGSNWLKRDGGVYTSATYPDLAALLGLKYAAFSGFGTQAYGTTDNIVSMAFGAGLLVTVGDGGKIRTSPTGATWTTRTSGTTEALVGIVWNGSLFVVVGFTGTILTSPDGITWTTRTSGTTNNLWGVAWSGTRFVACGESATIRVSADGAIWGTVTISGFTEGLFCAAYGNGRFVLGGGGVTNGGAAAVSTDDGTSWTWSRTGYPGGNVSMAFGKGRFITNGGNSVFLSRSGAGTWTAAPVAGNTTKVGFGLNQFFAFGTNFTSSSIDGDNWRSHTAVTGAFSGIGFTATDVFIGGSTGALAKGIRALDVVTQFQVPDDSPDIGYIKAL